LQQLILPLKINTVQFFTHVVRVCVRQSPQTPPSVFKLEGWNFTYRFLILMPKNTNQIIEILSRDCDMGFFLGSLLDWARWSRRCSLACRPTLASASILGVCIQNFSPLASKLRDEREMTDGQWTLVQYKYLQQYSFEIFISALGPAG